MKKINISSLISSLGKSVDDAIEEMKKTKISCELEEFELTTTFEAELDTLDIGYDPKTKHLKGLTFYETRKQLLGGKENIEKIENTNQLNEEINSGSITLRIVFSPRSE